MTEYVLFAPLLVLLMLATAEFGRAMMHYNALTKTLRDSVRFVAENAITNSTQVVNINATTRTQAQNLAVYGNTGGNGSPVLPGLAIADITVTGTLTGDVEVSALYDYQPIFASIPALVAGGSISTTFTFDAGVRMRAL